jgi:hypothetical protein
MDQVAGSAVKLDPYPGKDKESGTWFPERIGQGHSMEETTSYAVFPMGLQVSRN